MFKLKIEFLQGNFWNMLMAWSMYIANNHPFCTILPFMETTLQVSMHSRGTYAEWCRLIYLAPFYSQAKKGNNLLNHWKSERGSHPVWKPKVIQVIIHWESISSFFVKNSTSWDRSTSSSFLVETSLTLTTPLSSSDCPMTIARGIPASSHACSWASNLGFPL